MTLMLRFKIAGIAVLFLLATVARLNADVVTFDSVPGPYVAFAPGNGSLSVGSGALPGEDYIMDLSATGNPGNTTATLTTVQFVGGVDTAGGILDFNFFDSAQNAAGGFSVQLPQAGNFIWTIGVGAFVVPSSGFMDVVLDPNRPENAGVLAQWFITSTPPGVGSSPQDATGGNGDHSFSFTAIPEPVSGGLLGLVLLGTCLVRRRD